MVLKFSDQYSTRPTNITDKRLGKKDSKKLYFMRWSIETKYGIIKKKLQLENLPQGL